MWRQSHSWLQNRQPGPLEPRGARSMCSPGKHSLHICWMHGFMDQHGLRAHHVWALQTFSSSFNTLLFRILDFKVRIIVSISIIYGGVEMKRVSKCEETQKYFFENLLLTLTSKTITKINEMNKETGVWHWKQVNKDWTWTRVVIIVSHRGEMAWVLS